MSDNATITQPGSILQIDPAHVHVGFAAKHLMIATVRGQFSTVTGQVQFNEAKPSASKVSVTIDTHSLDTREPRRDAHLKSADFLEVEKFPVITFESTRIEGDVAGSFTLTGQLTIRGVTRPISLQVNREGTVRDPWGGTRTGYAAHGKLKRSEFGLTWNQALETGGVVVGDEVAISIELELIHQ